ncbi:MAG0920 family protein [Mycoplasmopsis felifaucium]|uniref:MAG0920 family protein n=1 Tax=Mycoplasmopsis felifaucium TaxID=35768 RepID=UPI0012EB8ACE|nr:hypothetical protein [Mycoplasmopsis felifaucium]
MVQKDYLNENIKLNPKVLRFILVRIFLCYLYMILFITFNIVLLTSLIILLKKYNFDIWLPLTMLGINVLILPLPLGLIIQCSLVVKKIKKNSEKIDDSRLLENIIKNDENRDIQISFKETNTFIFTKLNIAGRKHKDVTISSFKTKNKYLVYWNAILNYEGLAIIRNGQAIKISFGSFYNEFVLYGWINK